MPLNKIISESIDLSDTFNFTGNVTGAGGIINAQSFYLSASKTISSGVATVIDTTFTALDTTKVGILGSASNITVSSGIFSFASTGIYLIQTTMNFYFESTNQARYVMGNIEATANNSSYSNVAQATGNSVSASVNNDNVVLYPSCIVDVDDTSNVKVRLSTQADNNFKTETQNKGFTVRFIKLNDT